METEYALPFARLQPQTHERNTTHTAGSSKSLTSFISLDQPLLRKAPAKNVKNCWKWYHHYDYYTTMQVHINTIYVDAYYFPNLIDTHITVY